jgi:hypothetical protein
MHRACVRSIDMESSPTEQRRRYENNINNRHEYSLRPEFVPLSDPCAQAVHAFNGFWDVNAGRTQPGSFAPNSYTRITSSRLQVK